MVPVLSGIVTVLSAVGSVIEKAVSKSSAVAPSNPMVLPVPNSNPVVAGLVDLKTLIGRGILVT